MSTLDRSGRVAAAVGSVALVAFLFVSLVIGMPATGSTGGMGMRGGMWFVTAPLIVFPFVAALAFGYVGVRILASETDDAADTSDATDEDPIARLKREYAEGDLTEAAFERAVERELEAEKNATASADAERVRSVDR